MNRQVSEQVKKTITDEQAGFRTRKRPSLMNRQVSEQEKDHH